MRKNSTYIATEVSVEKKNPGGLFKFMGKFHGAQLSEDFKSARMRIKKVPFETRRRERLERRRSLEESVNR